ADVTAPRRLSQAISEGAGISVIVRVADAAAAGAAEEQGAEAVAVEGISAGLRAATRLPVLCHGASPEEARGAGADACLLVVEQVRDEDDLAAVASAAHLLGLELVVDVHDEEELELALERLDPEIFLLSPRGADDDEEPIHRVLSRLPDVPGGTLALAALPVPARDQEI